MHASSESRWQQNFWEYWLWLSSKRMGNTGSESIGSMHFNVWWIVALNQLGSSKFLMNCGSESCKGSSKCLVNTGSESGSSSCTFLPIELIALLYIMNRLHCQKSPVKSISIYWKILWGQKATLVALIQNILLLWLIICMKNIVINSYECVLFSKLLLNLPAVFFSLQIYDTLCFLLT